MDRDDTIRMAQATTIMLVVGVLGGAAITAALMTNKYRDGVWVPCGVAEISPDVPPQLKEWCRKQQRIKP